MVLSHCYVYLGVIHITGYFDKMQYTVLQVQLPLLHALSGFPSADVVQLCRHCASVYVCIYIYIYIIYM